MRPSVPSRFELPLLGSNQDSPDPMPLRLSPPPSWAFVVWTVPSPAPLRGQVAPTQSLHLPLSGLGSALPVKGPPTSRAFTHAVSGVVSSECTVRCGQSQACCQLHQGAVPAPGAVKRPARNSTRTGARVQLGRVVQPPTDPGARRRSPTRSGEPIRITRGPPKPRLQETAVNG